MSDEELVQAFERLELAGDAFTHAAHVRVGWWYLRQHDLPEALGRFSMGLRRFAAHHGAAGKYHQTITVAYMLLIAERLHDARGLSWEAFAARNADLLLNRPSALERYYSPELLRSERARAGFAMPDRVAVEVACGEMRYSRAGTS